MSWIGGGEKELTTEYNGRPWIKPWDSRGGTSVGKLQKRREGLQVLTSTNTNYLAAAAKSLQLCPTLCDPIEVSPPGSPIPGILQARTLEWVAISFSNA